MYVRFFRESTNLTVKSLLRILNIGRAISYCLDSRTTKVSGFSSNHPSLSPRASSILPLQLFLTCA